MSYADRDTVCQKGKFRLEEWEDVNYCEHCFYNGDEPLGDEEVVLLLGKLTTENEQLKSEYKVLHTQYQDLKKFVENNFDEHLTQEKLNRQIIKLSDENEHIKQTIKDMLENERTELGQSVLKQLQARIQE